MNAEVNRDDNPHSLINSRQETRRVLPAEFDVGTFFTIVPGVSIRINSFTNPVGKRNGVDVVEMKLPNLIPRKVPASEIGAPVL